MLKVVVITLLLLLFASSFSFSLSLPSVSAKCYTPQGDSCKWYRLCLEQRYPCERDEASYAIAYAEKYCDMYSQSYETFSKGGKQWIDAVRKCLQLKLVPLLSSERVETCASIKKFAFDSHPSCYVNPGAGIPSICSIPRDWIRVFWTIKHAFIDAFPETMIQMVQTLELCGSKFIGFPSSIQLLKLTVPFPKQSVTTTSNHQRIGDLQLAEIAGHSLASTIGLDATAFDWFSYASSVPTTSAIVPSTAEADTSAIVPSTAEADQTTLTINFLIAEKTSLDEYENENENNKNNTSNNSNHDDEHPHQHIHAIPLTHIFNILLQQVNQGMLYIKFSDSTHMVSSLKHCNDHLCAQPLAQAVSPPISSSSPSLHSPAHHIISNSASSLFSTLYFHILLLHLFFLSLLL